MSGGRRVDLFGQLLRFCLSIPAIVITAALVAGAFLAFQSKLPVDLTPFELELEQGGENIRRFGYDIPIERYGGPVVLTLEYSAPTVGCEILLLMRDGEEPLRRVPLHGARGGNVRLMLYPGGFPAGGAFKVLFSAEEPLASDLAVSVARLDLPKAGFWLHPNPLLWIALVLFGVMLGIAAAALWSDSAAATACYCTTALAQVLAIHFLGLEFASNLAGMLPGAVLLVIAVVVFRLLVPERAEESTPSPKQSD